MTYFRLGDYDTSYNHIQKAYQLFNTLHPCDAELQRLGILCAIDFVDNARAILGAYDVVSLAWEVEERCTALSDDLVHGLSLLNLGIALNTAQQRQEALYHMDCARTKFKAVGHSQPCSCLSCHFLGTSR